jgi:uncharacterized protein
VLTRRTGVGSGSLHLNVYPRSKVSHGNAIVDPELTGVGRGVASPEFRSAVENDVGHGVARFNEVGRGDARLNDVGHRSAVVELSKDGLTRDESCQRTGVGHGVASPGLCQQGLTGASGNAREVGHEDATVHKLCGHGDARFNEFRQRDAVVEFSQEVLTRGHGDARINEVGHEVPQLINCVGTGLPRLISCVNRS